MSRQAIVVGTGGHARVVISMLLEQGSHHCYNILEIGEARSNEKIMGIRAGLRPSNLEEYTNRSDIDFYIAIGDNSLRRNWWERLASMGFSMPLLISKSAVVDKSSRLGHGTVVCARAFIGPECEIGINNLINTGAIIEHEVNIGNHCHIAPGSCVAGRVNISNQCFIGAGATVIDNIAISQGTTLGAGSVLINSIDQINKTLVGVPARFTRDKK